MCKELRALVGQFESILTPDDRVPMFFLLSSERPFPQREVEKWRESGNDAELLERVGPTFVGRCFDMLEV